MKNSFVGSEFTHIKGFQYGQSDLFNSDQNQCLNQIKNDSIKTQILDENQFKICYLNQHHNLSLNTSQTRKEYGNLDNLQKQQTFFNFGQFNNEQKEKNFVGNKNQQKVVIKILIGVSLMIVILITLLFSIRYYYTSQTYEMKLNNLIQELDKISIQTHQEQQIRINEDEQRQNDQNIRIRKRQIQQIRLQDINNNQNTIQQGQKLNQIKILQIKNQQINLLIQNQYQKSDPDQQITHDQNTIQLNQKQIKLYKVQQDLSQNYTPNQQFQSSQSQLVENSNSSFKNYTNNIINTNPITAHQQKSNSQNQLKHSFPNSKASLILQKSLYNSFSPIIKDSQTTPPFKSDSITQKSNKQSKAKQNNYEFNNFSTKQMTQQMKLQNQQSCGQYVFEKLQKYGWLYQFANSHQQFRIRSEADSFIPKYTLNVQAQKYSEAIDLLQIIHHVSSNGQVQTQDTPCQSAQKLKIRLIQAMQKQYLRLNSTYQIQNYHKKQLSFCIVTNSYKNARNGLIYRNIDSILQQNYTNYHVVYTDDASPDLTGKKVTQYLASKNISTQKFKVKINERKVGMMENIYKAITEDCQQHEIVVMLDGDDSFIGTNVLSLLNAIYQKQRIALMWNNFLEIEQNSKALMGFSKDIDDYQKYNKRFRIVNKFYYSHLKSFYVSLFKNIKVEDLQEDNGQFYGGASNTAIMLSLIQLAYPYYRYIPQIVYQYRYDTGQVGMTTNRDAQLRALDKISDTTPYKLLQSFWFIDLAHEKALIL